MAYSATLAHADDRTGLIIMGSFFCLSGFVAVAFRLYARRLAKTGLGTDDWLCLIALILVTALNGIFIAGTAQGAITGHSPVVNNWPQTTELEHLVEKYKYAFQSTEKLAFGFIKLSLLFLWKRIFKRSRPFNTLCWVMIVVTAAWSITFFFATIFQCGTDFQKNWAPITIFLTQCTNTLNMLTVFTATDLLTDFVIMFMPIPLIWSLHMPTRKKVGVTYIFMFGLFTIGSGIARMYIYLVTSYDKEHNPDFIADFTLFILWSEIEANVAMLVCCMPATGPVLVKFHDGLKHSFRSIKLSSWTPLPPAKVSKNLRKDTLPTSTSDIEMGPPVTPVQMQAPATYWPEPSNGVMALGYSDSHKQSMDGTGIFTRTEISRKETPLYY